MGMQAFLLLKGGVCNRNVKGSPRLGCGKRIRADARCSRYAESCIQPVQTRMTQITTLFIEKMQLHHKQNEDIAVFSFCTL